ncbi:MAG: hypothetical protein LIO74_05805 [Ruminococcus sp.]|nr:hypothetical protein [Ruminococcus sp.]MCD7958027.1 hypothetical protein [Ruminococcus sp.]
MNPGSGKATASLVLGIISLIGICSPIIGVVCGIVAIVLSRMSVKESQALGFPADGKAKAGLILGIIGIAIGVVNYIVTLLLYGSKGLFDYGEESSSDSSSEVSGYAASFKYLLRG